MKTVLDFERKFTRKENNKDSQEHLEKNKKKFSNQCKKAYEAMLKGERLSTVSALLNYGIGDLRRRVKDLKDIHKVDVKSEWVRKGGNRFKEYFFDPI